MEYSEALALGLKKYDTGRPCQNGHFAPRYVQSRTCEACIRMHAVRVGERYAAQRDAERRPEVDRFRLEVKSMTIRTTDAGRESVQAVAEALLAGRYPAVVGLVTMRDGRSGRDRVGGAAMYPYLLHPDDEATIRAMANATMFTADAPPPPGPEAYVDKQGASILPVYADEVAP